MTKTLQVIGFALALVTAGASGVALSSPQNPNSVFYPDKYWGK